jgi:hypothetical protein
VCAERKKGKVQNATDLGVGEWRISVGRAETTRKGEREEEGAADDDCQIYNVYQTRCRGARTKEEEQEAEK